MSKPPLLDTAALTHCNYEEADIRVILHVDHTAHNGHNKILIHTVDTDVAMAVALVCTLEEETEVCVSFGIGKAFWFLVAHEMACALRKGQALPMFYALMGCDMVFCFTRHGKRTAWSVWTNLPQLTQKLTDLSTAPDHIDEDAMHTIERFIILLSDRISTTIDINKGHHKLFCKEEQCPADPIDKCWPEAVRLMSNIPGWTCLGFRP